MTLAAGTRLGPYEIVGVLGAGGMGEVYRARDTRLGRTVAIKVVTSELASDDHRLRRFEQEARAASMLNHPNILIVHDVGTHDGTPYIVSELLEGQTLRARLEAGPVSTRDVVAYAIQIATGLAAAHERGIVHRDLKPENVFVTPDGRVKILDFGLAKLTGSHVADGSAVEAATITAETKAGVVMGTVAYMSPEQARGLPTDHRTDIFALGVILYELAAGERPFKGETAADTISAILSKDPFDVEPPARDLPPSLTPVIRHCLGKRPEGRFQSARDIAFMLETLSSGVSVAAIDLAPTSRWKPKAVAIAAALVLASAAGGFLLARQYAMPRPTEATFHQLTFRRGYVLSARFAPDGGSAIYGAAWDGDPVQLFTTRTDRVESFPLPGASADILSISPSGESLISLGRHYLDGWTNSGTLARVSPGAGAPREILDNVQDADWSKNGDEVAAIHRLEGQSRLEWPIGRVLHTTTSWLSHVRVSPAGDLVAFFDHPVYGDDRGAVVVSDRQGNKRVLSDGWATLGGLAWSVSGNEVWFSGSTSGTSRQLYAASLAGNVRPLLPLPGSVTLHDISHQGRVLVAVETLRASVAGVAVGERDERSVVEGFLNRSRSLAGRPTAVALGTRRWGVAALRCLSARHGWVATDSSRRGAEPGAVA